MQALSTLERYFAQQIYAAVLFVLFGFLALFAFMNLVQELGNLGNGNYHLREIFLYVLLSAPSNAYELFPIVVLIGTLYVLAHLASNSEFTVMRGSGLWFKDDRAFINVREARQAHTLEGVKIYEFDSSYRLNSITAARRGEYRR